MAPASGRVTRGQWPQGWRQLTFQPNSTLVYLGSIRRSGAGPSQSCSTRKFEFAPAQSTPFCTASAFNDLDAVVFDVGTSISKSFDEKVRFRRVVSTLTSTHQFTSP